jgi:RNA polymerase sigma-B factor
MSVTQVTFEARVAGTISCDAIPEVITMTATTIRAKRSEDFSDTGDLQLVMLIQAGPRESAEREAACEELVHRYKALVRSCAQRYRDSPESQDELTQVGYLGLMKAINNFDPHVGSSLVAYALPCISGEIKRHFRDKRWQVHVKRSAQELRLEVRRATAELTQQLARKPMDAELARYLSVSEQDLNDARRADLVFQASSLDAPLSDGHDATTLADLLGADDSRMEHALDMEAVWTHWEELPRREQRLLMMRFYGNMTQAEIAEQLGISQMHVSRLLARALAYLRGRILTADEDDSPPADGENPSDGQDGHLDRVQASAV